MAIETPSVNWKAIRSYEDFKWLHAALKSQFPAHFLPQFPKQEPDATTTETFSVFLYDYLKYVVSVKEFIHSKHLVSFLSAEEAEFNSIKMVVSVNLETYSPILQRSK